MLDRLGIVKQRLLVFITLVFGLGLVIGFFQFKGATLFYAVGILLSCALFIINFKPRHSLWWISILFLSFFVAALYGNIINSFEEIPIGKYLVKGEVLGTVSKREEGSYKAILKDVLLNGAGEMYSIKKVYWTFQTEDQKEIPFDGEHVIFEGNLYRPNPKLNPFGYDFRATLFFKGIHYGISGNNGYSTIRNQGSHYNPLLRLKENISGVMKKAFVKSFGFAKALIIGEREDIGEDSIHAFRLNGISHVLAISGLHITIIAGMLEFVLRKLFFSKKVSCVMILNFLIFYCIFLEFTPSVLRASIMYALFSLGKLMRRYRDGLSILAVSALLILLLFPYQIFNLGFQLSYSAVLGIIVMGDFLSSKLNLERKNIYVKKLASAYLLTFSASLLTAPLSLHYFHYVSLIGLLLSPFAVLAIGVLIPLYFIGIILFVLLGNRAIVMTGIIDNIGSLFINLNNTISQCSSTGISSYIFTPLIVFLVFAFMLTLSRYCGLRAKIKHTVLLVLSLLIVFLLIPRTKPHILYTQFSCGAADAALIESDDKIYVIDTAVDGYEVANYVKAKGGHIDKLFISHLHKDHAGGIKKLLDENIKIDKAYFPIGCMDAGDIDKETDVIKYLEYHGVQVEFLAAGDVISDGRLKVEIFWPYRNARYSYLKANNGSLCALWTLDDTRLLTTGDIGSEYELYSAAKADILKVAHHGSKNSSKNIFLKQVNPSVAIISNSLKNYQRTINVSKRLERNEIDIYTCLKNGAVIVEIMGGEFLVKNYAGGE